MKERKILAQKIRDFEIQDFIARELTKTGYTRTEIQRTPLGDKVIIYTSRPGLVVGRKGANIKKLTDVLKKKFKMENPQIEIGEVQNPLYDAQSVAERIAFTLERYGPMRFKAVGYKVLQQIMDAGVLGAEIIISGRGLPSTRAKSWRFMNGYLKKSGDVSQSMVSYGLTVVNLKTGTIGIKVRIMTPDIELPDIIHVNEIPEQSEKNPEQSEEKKEGEENKNDAEGAGLKAKDSAEKSMEKPATGADAGKKNTDKRDDKRADNLTKESGKTSTGDKKNKENKKSKDNKKDTKKSIKTINKDEIKKPVIRKAKSDTGEINTEKEKSEEKPEEEKKPESEKSNIPEKSNTRLEILKGNDTESDKEVMSEGDME